MSDDIHLSLQFVACANDLKVLGERLLSSPCLRSGDHLLNVFFNATSAADGFNAAMRGAAGSLTDGDENTSWLVWAHQDVFLPDGWDRRFVQALADAVQRFPRLAVAGVYGIAGTGNVARRAGHVLDRGTLLHESAALPCLVDSLDELLFAVRVDSGLRLNAALGFDFYATDLVLRAHALGWQCAVVDALCEHWSGTPASGAVSLSVVDRIKSSARVFESLWAAHLPITTPCFNITSEGDVARFIDSIVDNPG